MLRRAYKPLGHSKPLIAPSGINRGEEAYLRIGMGQRFSDLHGLTQRWVVLIPSMLKQIEHCMQREGCI